MRVKTGRLLAWAFVLLSSQNLHGEDPKQLVEQAVQTELAADRNDHSRWLYLETDRKSGRSLKQWVAETPDGDLHRILETNGQPISEPEQRRRMESFIHDPGAQTKQRKGQQHDDHQASELLNLLPQAFVWRDQGTKDGISILHFTPNPQFRPPDFEAKVFAAMEGDMSVDAAQRRIVSLKGRLIHDVKIAGGLLGSLSAGGTFDVERRETASKIWQITETHVHIQGHALIFKTISEQEDDTKTGFRQLPGNTSVQQAEGVLLAQGK